MPFFLNDDGTAIYLDWHKDEEEVDRRLDALEVCYPTLTGACLYGGVQASAFDQVFRKVELFDGSEWNKTGKLVSVGWAPDYKITFFKGEAFFNPLRRHDVQNARRAA